MRWVGKQNTVDSSSSKPDSRILAWDIYVLHVELCASVCKEMALWGLSRAATSRPFITAHSKSSNPGSSLAALNAALYCQDKPDNWHHCNRVMQYGSLPKRLE